MVTDASNTRSAAWNSWIGLEGQTAWISVGGRVTGRPGRFATVCTRQRLVWRHSLYLPPTCVVYDRIVHLYRVVYT